MATHPLVLLIEPDPMLQQLIHGELKDQGCIVFDTATGAEALAFAELYPGAIDLAVTDLETSDSGEVDFVDALRSLPTGGQAKVSSLMKPFDRGDVRRGGARGAASLDPAGAGRVWRRGGVLGFAGRPADRSDHPVEDRPVLSGGAIRLVALSEVSESRRAAAKATKSLETQPSSGRPAGRSVRFELTTGGRKDSQSILAEPVFLSLLLRLVTPERLA